MYYTHSVAIGVVHSGYHNHKDKKRTRQQARSDRNLGLESILQLGFLVGVLCDLWLILVLGFLLAVMSLDCSALSCSKLRFVAVVSSILKLYMFVLQLVPFSYLRFVDSCPCLCSKLYFFLAMICSLRSMLLCSTFEPAGGQEERLPARTSLRTTRTSWYIHSQLAA